MAEEGHYQPLKQIRFEDDNDEDIISTLPDCLLVEILSRLPETKYAIRACTLSRRWKHIWHSVPNLVFRHPYCYETGYGTSPDFFSFVNETLTQRPQLKLNKFRLYCRYNYLLESQINNWIRYAMNCNVEELDLWLWGQLERIIEFPLDQFVFICSSFTDLTLSGCSFNPTTAISWKNLRSLCFIHVKLDEDLIESILSGSPVLETLMLNNCYGYKRLNITSKSVKNLVFSGYTNPHGRDFKDNIEINAPNILSLTIKYLVLGKLLLLDVSSLVEAHLNYWQETTISYEEETPKRFILDLRHVKDLKIGNPCYKVLTRLKAKGFPSPSNLKIMLLDLYTHELDASEKRKEEKIIQRFETSSEKLDDIIRAQRSTKLKAGLGYDYTAVPPPLNDNYTSLPHFSYNTSKEDMSYGVGRIPKPVKFVPPASQIAALVLPSDKTNINVSFEAGCVEESGSLETDTSCDYETVCDETLVEKCVIESRHVEVIHAKFAGNLGLKQITYKLRD
ncbi:F-box protein At5g03100-like [Bidens hawaiensis]|uniref:F-box protein At5g03100-like n=1 Tax=Bidens hawaiensis TaxID=980011 RepID=UPI00404B1A78